jgi:lactate dehydrogenase-like 2-hydroxyacid dehydrogenase
MHSKPKLLIADSASGKFLPRVLERIDDNSFEISYPETENEDSLIKLVKNVDAVLCYQANISHQIISNSKSLKFIQKHGLNCKNIDIDSAQKRNITISTQTLLRNVTVAEQALALIIACARKIIPGHTSVKDAVYLNKNIQPIKTSQWNIQPNWPELSGISEVYGSSVGIIGLGDIGMEIAKRCHAFGMNIFYYQRTRHNRDIETLYSATFSSFNDLIQKVDYIVLVIPHTDESEGLIGKRELKMMKKSATLINVGRGGLIKEMELIEALQAKEIKMAGLDVYEIEPLPSSSPLIKLDNVVLLPHTGAGSNKHWDTDIPSSLKKIKDFFKS